MRIYLILSEYPALQDSKNYIRLTIPLAMAILRLDANPSKVLGIICACAHLIFYFFILNDNSQIILITFDTSHQSQRRHLQNISVFIHIYVNYLQIKTHQHKKMVTETLDQFLNDW